MKIKNWFKKSIDNQSFFIPKVPMFILFNPFLIDLPNNSPLFLHLTSIYFRISKIIHIFTCNSISCSFSNMYEILYIITILNVLIQNILYEFNIIHCIFGCFLSEYLWAKFCWKSPGVIHLPGSYFRRLLSLPFFLISNFYWPPLFIFFFFVISW